MKPYTKQALAEALKSLMQSKPIDRITVRELVERCDVNRQTFYYHFQDIYALLAYIFETETVGAIHGKRSYDTWQQGLHIILMYVQENKKLCVNTYRSIAREYLESFLVGALYDLLGGVFDEVEGAAALAGEPRDFILRFYSYAFCGTLLEWIATGLALPAETLEANIATVMDGIFSAVIDNFAGRMK